MHSYRLVTLLAILLIAMLPMAVVQAEGEDTPTTVGTAARSDSITYTLSNVPVPVSGTAYEGWLVSDDGSVSLSTGVMTVASDGSVNHTFDSESAGYSGINLIATFDKVLITEEQSPDDSTDSSGVVLYSHQIPSGAMIHIRNLVSNGEAEGSTEGVLTSLKTQLDIAITHAKLASEATDLDSVKQHIHHVVNVLEGSDGANYDSAHTDPGDGYGAINYAVDRSHASSAAATAPDDESISVAAALVEVNGKNADTWATQARDGAVNNIINQTNLALAKIYVGPGGNTVISLLEAARDGIDADRDGTIESIANEGGAQQAYVEAQKMATYTLTAGAETTSTAAATTEEEPEPPVVGDPSILRIVQLVFVSGLLFIVTGSVFVRQSRKLRNTL